MKHHHFAHHSETIEQAEAAFADSEQRNTVLKEMLAGIALSEPTCQLLFDASGEEVAAAEQELLAEFRRCHPILPTEQGEVNNTRPIVMRGLKI